MNMRLAYLSLVALLALAGCRQDPSVREIEGELFWLEDQIVQLEAEYDLKVAELDACRRKNSELQGRPETDPDDGPDSSGAKGPHGALGSADLTVPEVDLGTPADPSLPADEFGPALPPVHDPDRPYEEEVPDLDFRPSGAVGPAIDGVSTSMDDTKVDHIVLNRQLTGGHDVDGQPGDEGVLVVIEPRDADDRYVPAPAAVSVVLLDPAQSGQSAQLARWDFDVAEATSATRTSLLGRGIHLAMPWPNRPPANSHLRLFVRYTTSDGRKLEADRFIDVDPPRAISARWTPAPKTTPASGTTRAASVPHEPAGPSASYAEPRAALRPEETRPSSADRRTNLTARLENPGSPLPATPEPRIAAPLIVPASPRPYGASNAPSSSSGTYRDDTWRPTR